jgi:hypothetical protein
MLQIDDTVNNEERNHMVTLECPWCDGPMALEAEAKDVACEACGVRVELAPDPLPRPIARAA